MNSKQNVMSTTLSGSCDAAGFTGCCNDTTSTCAGSDGTCYCDQICYPLGDCCDDISDICDAQGQWLQPCCIQVGISHAHLLYPQILQTFPTYHSFHWEALLELQLFQCHQMMMALQVQYQFQVHSLLALPFSLIYM